MAGIITRGKSPSQNVTNKIQNEIYTNFDRQIRKNAFEE